MSVTCLVDFENVRKQTIVPKQTIKKHEFPPRKQLFASLKIFMMPTIQVVNNSSEQPLFTFPI